MLPNSIVVGYHGCDADTARNVINRRTTLRISANDYDWLGHGVYFWIGGPQRAMHWAREKAQLLGRDPAKASVLGAVVDLGHCLDLADYRSVQFLQEAYSYFREGSIREGGSLLQNTGRTFGNRKLDCAVFESLHKLRKKNQLPSFDTVAGYFVEGAEVYPGAAVRSLDHVQLCVRNPAKIAGCFLPSILE